MDLSCIGLPGGLFGAGVRLAEDRGGRGVPFEPASVTGAMEGMCIFHV